MLFTESAFPRRELRYENGDKFERLQKLGSLGIPLMSFVLVHPEIRESGECIVGATAAPFNRFKDLHAHSKTIREHRMEQVKNCKEKFQKKLLEFEEAHLPKVRQNPRSFGIDPANLELQFLERSISAKARTLALADMSGKSVGGRGGYGEAFRKDLTQSASPCYTCRGLWEWNVATPREPIEAEDIKSLSSWSEKTHGAAPARCAETAAYLELRLREYNM